MNQLCLKAFRIINLQSLVDTNFNLHSKLYTLKNKLVYYTPIRSTRQRFCLSSVSLDSALLTSSRLPINTISSSIFLMFSTFILANKNIATSIGVIEKSFDIRRFFSKFTSSIIPGIALFSRIFFAKLLLLIEVLVKKLIGISNRNKRELVGQEDWSICTLNERESISNKFVKYRFELETPSAVVPVEIGQEVIITYTYPPLNIAIKFTINF